MNRFLFVKTKTKYTMIPFDYRLEDDETDHGGVSFIGETLGDFLDDIGLFPESLSQLNKALAECGIKKIRV